MKEFTTIQLRECFVYDQLVTAQDNKKSFGKPLIKFLSRFLHLMTNGLINSNLAKTKQSYRSKRIWVIHLNGNNGFRL